MKDGKNEIAIKRLNLAKRYLENAKEDLKKDGIDKKANCYIDLKYISKAYGEVKNIEGLGKDRDLLLALI